MARPTMNQVDIQLMAGHTVFQRGLSYYRLGAVQAIVQRGDILQAEVQGSDSEPYLVIIRFRAAAPHLLGCSCPYEGGGICKHTVAALLTLVEQPELIEERPPLATVLAALDRDQLQALVLNLAEAHPEVVDWIEAQGRSASDSPVADAPTLPADPAAIRRQINQILNTQPHYQQEYWDDDGDDETTLAIQALSD